MPPALEEQNLNHWRAREFTSSGCTSKVNFDYTLPPLILYSFWTFSAWSSQGDHFHGLEAFQWLLFPPTIHPHVCTTAALPGAQTSVLPALLDSWQWGLFLLFTVVEKRPSLRGFCTSSFILLEFSNYLELHRARLKFEISSSQSSLEGSFPGGSDGKESAHNMGDLGSIPGWEDPLGKGMATHSSSLAWRIRRTEEPGGLVAMGSQRVGHDWVTSILANLKDHLFSDCPK